MKNVKSLNTHLWQSRVLKITSPNVVRSRARELQTLAWATAEISARYGGVSRQQTKVILKACSPILWCSHVQDTEHDSRVLEWGPASVTHFLWTEHCRQGPLSLPRWSHFKKPSCTRLALFLSHVTCPGGSQALYHEDTQEPDGEAPMVKNRHHQPRANKKPKPSTTAGTTWEWPPHVWTPA